RRLPAQRAGGLEQVHGFPPGSVRQHAVDEAAHLRNRPRRGILRRSGAAEDHEGCRTAQLPLVGSGTRYRQKHAIPDEEDERVMMIITQKAIPRRTMLKAAGAALALPFIDAMVPALAQTPKAPNRLSVVYLPNGVMMNNWTPDKE